MAPSALVKVKVIYLFAGKQRHSDIGSFLRQHERSGPISLDIQEFDIERSSQHDITKDKLWEEVFTTLKEGGWILIVPPPCNTFSRARFQYLKCPGPRPLRNYQWPRCFPWLSVGRRRIVDIPLIISSIRVWWPVLFALWPLFVETSWGFR